MAETCSGSGAQPRQRGPNGEDARAALLALSDHPAASLMPLARSRAEPPKKARAKQQPDKT